MIVKEAIEKLKLLDPDLEIEALVVSLLKKSDISHEVMSSGSIVRSGSVGINSRNDSCNRS